MNQPELWTVKRRPRRRHGCDRHILVQSETLKAVTLIALIRHSFRSTDILSSKSKNLRVNKRIQIQPLLYTRRRAHTTRSATRRVLLNSDRKHESVLKWVHFRVE
jgi:hypothetical protein